MTTVLRSSIARRCVRVSFDGRRRPDPGPPPSRRRPQHRRRRPARRRRRSSATPGIWYVPTAEVLGHGKWSASGYRRGTNWIQGYTNVADFAGTFAFGIKDRAEVFGSFLVDTRIDRDIRPLFVNDPTFGGIIDRYPQVNQDWTGDNVGDFYARREVSTCWSEYRQNPAAIAVRAHRRSCRPARRTPASAPAKPDVSIDFIVSKEAAKLVEVSGYGGYEFRGSPDGFDTPSGAFRWGAGVGVPVAQPAARLRRVERPGAVEGHRDDHRHVARRHRLQPRAGDLEHREHDARHARPHASRRRTASSLGAGVSWNVPTRARSSAFTDEADVIGDYYDMQFRIGYHPGVRVYVPPPPPRAAHRRRRCPRRRTGRRRCKARVRAVHGGSRQDVDGHRRRAGSRRRHAHVSLDGAGGTLREPGRSPDASGRRRSRKGRCR